MSKITEAVSAAIAETIGQLGYELVEVKFGKEYGQDTMTVYIDAQDPIGLTDCEKVSNAVDPILEELDPTRGAPYNLNVSSAGLDRPIKTDDDYRRNTGREVEAKLYAPLKGTKRKTVEGVLVGKDGDLVTIAGADGETVLQLSQIALLTQLIKFD